MGLANYIGNATDEKWSAYKQFFQPIYDQLGGKPSGLDLDSKLEFFLTDDVNAPGY